MCYQHVGPGAYPVVILARARQQRSRTCECLGRPRPPRPGPQGADLRAGVQTVIEIHAESWKGGGKSAARWRASLRDYALPKIDTKRVDS